MGWAILVLMEGRARASEGVSVPPLTVDVVYPELRANAHKAVYFVREEISPTHHQISWKKMARWIGTLKPLSAPDRRAGYIAIYSLPDDVVFIAIHRADDESSPTGGGVAVFRVERRRTEMVNSWNRDGRLESTPVGGSRWLALFDNDGRVMEDTWFVWGPFGWSIGGKEKFTYWPGTSDVRTVSHFGYPRAYDENQPWKVTEIPQRPKNPPRAKSDSP